MCIDIIYIYIYLHPQNIDTFGVNFNNLNGPRWLSLWMGSTPNFTKDFKLVKPWYLVKLGQICLSQVQLKIIAVGANWTVKQILFGFLLLIRLWDSLSMNSSPTLLKPDKTLIFCHGTHLYPFVPVKNPKKHPFSGGLSVSGPIEQAGLLGGLSSVSILIHINTYL